MVTLTLDDLLRIFEAVAGADESVNLDGDIIDIEFTELGYDSIAVLEVVGHVRRQYGISVEEDALADVHTPGGLLDLFCVAQS